MIDLNSPSVGMDRRTLRIITGWDHVLQSLDDIFTTRFGERCMREHFGSNVPILLGRRNITSREIVSYFMELFAPIEQWEPRFRVSQIVPREVTRLGAFEFFMEGEYRPRAVFGDFSVEGIRRVSANMTSERLSLERA